MEEGQDAGGVGASEGSSKEADGVGEAELMRMKDPAVAREGAEHLQQLLTSVAELEARLLELSSAIHNLSAASAVQPASQGEAPLEGEPAPRATGTAGSAPNLHKLLTSADSSLQQYLRTTMRLVVGLPVVPTADR